MLAGLPRYQQEEGQPHHEQGLIQAESIVKALGVTDGASFEALMAALTVAEPEGMGSQIMGEPTLIHPADAVTQLREFVEAESGGAGATSSIGLAGMTAPLLLTLQHGWVTGIAVLNAATMLFLGVAF